MATKPRYVTLAARSISLENSYSNIAGRLETTSYCASGRTGEEKTLVAVVTAFLEIY